jgi:hypothetical protein
MARSVAYLSLLLAIVGCGSSVPTKQFSAEEIKAMGANRLKGIAEDKSLSDADSFKKYFDTNPSKPAVILPASVGPWTEVKPAPDGGLTLTVRDIDHPITRGDSVEDAESRVRTAIKARAEFVKTVLQHFQGRNLKAVTLALFTPITGKDEYVEALRVVVTQADVSKLEKATGPAAVGSEFDPRGPRIGELWKVELNRYPDIQYKKK